MDFPDHPLVFSTNFLIYHHFSTLAINKNLKFTITQNVLHASSSTGEFSRSVADVSNMAAASGDSASQLLGSVGELTEFSTNCVKKLKLPFRTFGPWRAKLPTNPGDNKSGPLQLPGCFLKKLNIW